MVKSNSIPAKVNPFQVLQHTFKTNKYRLLIFALLAVATIICIVLIRARIALTGSVRYSFLTWNLFLAWIPFGIAYLTFISSLSRRWLLLTVPISTFLWLIFFPNAPYILTDFQHLSTGGGEIPVWYDVLLLIWFSFTGLFLGLVSLFLMQVVVQRAFGRWIAWGFITTVILLTSIGVYIGRFLRWNSWDILRNPGGVAHFAFAYGANPSLRSIGFTGLFGIFFLFIYLLLYSFGHLLNESM
jgi:uncharacterized membrane protein